jgi:hypothetical protein
MQSWFPVCLNVMLLYWQLWRTWFEQLYGVSVLIPGGDPSASNGVMVDHEELLRRNTQNLMSAVSSLPELQVRQPITGGWRHQASNPGSCFVPCCVQHVRAVSHLPVAMLLC